MKTAGELLREKRLLKELTLEEIAVKIKIKPEYLRALEESNFRALPTASSAKGFLKNYATALRLNPETVLAMFRRDFEEGDAGEVIPRGLLSPVASRPRLISANLILTFAALFAFVGFLVYQLIGWWSLPKVEIFQPVSGEVYGEKVTVKGKTDRDSVVTINNESVIVDQNGQFSLDLLFPAGTHSVIIEAKNRQGKSRLAERTFQVTK